MQSPLQTPHVASHSGGSGGCVGQQCWTCIYFSCVETKRVLQVVIISVQIVGQHRTIYICVCFGGIVLFSALPQ